MEFTLCPYCKAPINQTLVNAHTFNGNGDFKTQDLYDPLYHKKQVSSGLAYSLQHYKCPVCSKRSVFFDGYVEPFLDATRLIIPKTTAPVLPDYIPEAIRQDYTEACDTVEISPKASATLSRRCLQGMIRDVFGVSERTLNAEILAIQSQVSPHEWSAINSVRQIGNIGAHMEADVNTIIEVEPEEAETLVLFIGRLINAWYIQRHSDDELINRIIEINNNKQQQRH